MCHDWLADALNGNYSAGYERKVYLRTGGGGPSGAKAMERMLCTGGSK